MSWTLVCLLTVLCYTAADRYCTAAVGHQLHVGNYWQLTEPVVLRSAGNRELTCLAASVVYLLQFWHIPFWRCSVGICRPPELDDVGFVEQVLQDLPTRLLVTPGKVRLGTAWPKLPQPAGLQGSGVQLAAVSALRRSG